MTQAKNPDYFFDEHGFIRLTNSVRKVKCPNCNTVLAIETASGAMLIKSTVTLMKPEDASMLLRCGGCHKFISMDKDKKVLTLS